MRSFTSSMLCTVCVLPIVLGCKAGPPPPGREEFKAASQKIGVSSGAGVFGNSESALAMATDFSEQMGKVDKLAFTGHKKRSFSLTGEKFLTYCHVNGDQVVFLVHVPQFKAYKSDVRAELISLSWDVATAVVQARGVPAKRLAVGLRGSLMYGGLAIGDFGSTTPETDNAAAVRESKLYSFFAAPGTTATSDVVTE
jgi:hypothetical protein